jgi:hypothetical protein
MADRYVAMPTTLTGLKSCRQRSQVTTLQSRQTRRDGRPDTQVRALSPYRQLQVPDEPRLRPAPAVSRAPGTRRVRRRAGRHQPSHRAEYLTAGVSPRATSQLLRLMLATCGVDEAGRFLLVPAAASPARSDSTSGCAASDWVAGGSSTLSALDLSPGRGRQQQVAAIQATRRLNRPTDQLTSGDSSEPAEETAVRRSSGET